MAVSLGCQLEVQKKKKKKKGPILSTSEGWKAESTLEPPSWFENGTPGLKLVQSMFKVSYEIKKQNLECWVSFCITDYDQFSVDEVIPLN